MSLAIPASLNKVLVVDPICDFQSEAVYAVEKSVSTSNYYSIISNNASSQSTTWTVNVNDNTTITDRLFLMDITFDVFIPVANGEFAAAKSYALRSLPLLKLSNNYVLQLGNGTCTLQSGQIANLIERYGFMDKYLAYGSTPNFTDLDAPYNALVNAGNISPFEYSASTQSEHCLPRGAFPPLRVVKAAGGLTLTYRVIEPIFLSPLLQSMCIKERKEGMTKLSQIQFTCNWGSPSRLFSTSELLPANTAITVNFSGANSILRVVQYVPSVLDVGRNINTQALPYNEVVSFSSNPQVLTFRADTTTSVSSVQAAEFVSPVIQLSRIPKELYIYCRPDDTFYNNPRTGCQMVDNFAVYDSTSLKVNFNGQNLLNNISDVSLYRICVENGVNVPWNLWSGQVMRDGGCGPAGTPAFGCGVGSPICLKFSKDIVLGADQAPGVNTKCNLQVSANFRSPLITQANSPYSGGSLSHTMFLVVVYEGVIEFYGSGGTVAQTLGALSTADVLEAVKQNTRVHYDIVNDYSFGGSMMDRARNFVKGKSHYFTKFKDALSHPLAKAVGSKLKEQIAERNPDVASVLNTVGLGQMGGKSISKANLKKMLLR
jgi:hypothetical protein